MLADPARRRRRALAALAGLSQASGECKTIHIKRRGKGGRKVDTGCTMQLCHTGRGATGWTFMAGTRRCPR